jgi:succinyl-CoA synthetase beta subunit
MLLLEHDAKEFVHRKGIPIPDGIFVEGDSIQFDTPAGPGPWVVKAQVSVGGRGKAGGIGFAKSATEIVEFVEEKAGMSIKGHKICGFRIEQRIRYIHEIYLSLLVDPSNGGIRILLSAQGGVDVEENVHRADEMLTATSQPDKMTLVKVALELLRKLPLDIGEALAPAIAPLCHIFIESDATLLEINPLFILSDGTWVAGDLKMAIDENAFPRQAELAQIVLNRPDVYRETVFKLTHEFDYIEIDPKGQIGLLTTGAGLSMMLVDEMLRAGRRPFNFCDVRTGLLRGSPTRLIEVLRQFTRRPDMTAILVNIFAGITDLEEFAKLLLEALDAVPEITVPVIARLIGNNFEAAQRLIEQSGRSITVEMDLDRALCLAITETGIAA